MEAAQPWPPTPEHPGAHRGPKTPSPPPHHNSKPVVSPTRATSKSPEPNCAICLGKLANKSFTDRCMHQFCFTCLLEWSKVKAECPLCKQPFKSIIHNVRSLEDYDQYHIEHREELEEHHHIQTPFDRRFRYRTTLTSERRRDLLSRDHLFHSLYRSLRDFLPYRRPRRRVATSEYRQYVYEHNLWVQPIADVTGRYREASPAFYRENPACTHRLVPWVNREVSVLLRQNPTRVAFVLEMIMGLVLRMDIRSEEFRSQVHPYFSENTDHFIHEFYNFARAPYDMIGYDREIEYSSHRPESLSATNRPEASSPVLVSVSDNSDSDATVVVLSSPEPQRTEPVLGENIHGVEVVTSSSNEPSTSGVSANALSRVQLFFERLSACDNELTTPQPSTSTGQSAWAIDSDDDCQVVDVVKPRGERTPLVVTLASSEDEEEDNIPLAQLSVVTPKEESGSEWTPERSETNLRPTQTAQVEDEENSDESRERARRKGSKRHLHWKKSMKNSYKRSSKNAAHSPPSFSSSDSDFPVRTSVKRRMKTKPKKKFKRIRHNSSSSERSSERTLCKPMCNQPTTSCASAPYSREATTSCASAPYSREATTSCASAPYSREATTSCASAPYNREELQHLRLSVSYDSSSDNEKANTDSSSGRKLRSVVTVPGSVSQAERKHRHHKHKHHKHKKSKESKRKHSRKIYCTP